LINAATIQTEEELGDVLAICGFVSVSPQLSPVWAPWTWEWRGKRMPLALYLKGFRHDDFFVAIKEGAFQIYEMHKQDHWFRLVGELQGDISEKELADMILNATHGASLQS
jgi:hypothetical protein